MRVKGPKFQSLSLTSCVTLNSFITSLVLSFLIAKVQEVGLRTPERPFSCGILGLWHQGRLAREETGDKLATVCPSYHIQRCDSTRLSL